MSTRGDEPFLGKRNPTGVDENNKPVFGPYEWQTYRDVDREVEDLSNSMYDHQMTPDIQGEGKTWRFVGVWSQNRPEWTKIELACMNYKVTTIGFYDAMGASQVDYILN